MPSGSHKNSGSGGHSGTTGGSHISGNHSGASNSTSRSYSSSRNTRDYSSHSSYTSTSDMGNSIEFDSVGQALTVFLICMGILPLILGIIFCIQGNSKTGILMLSIGIALIVFPLVIRLIVYAIKNFISQKRETKTNVKKEK